jgi:CHAD domain-containing protein
MKWKPSRNTAENAAAELPKLAEKYFRAGRKAVERDTKPRQLHQFRVATKRFRYALELFRPIYGTTLDQRLKSLRGIQDALGKISDYQTIQKLIAGDGELRAKVHKGLEKSMREFRDEWKAFDSGGELKRWKAYLTRVRVAAKRTQHYQ